MRIARSTLIGTAVAIALFGRNGGVQAAAPSGDAATGELQEVVVTGIRASLAASLEQKRDTTSVVEVITAEDIGKMPDKNIADSLKRVPGVTISSAGASEGGFDENDRVSLRGTGPSLTQTLINGHNVASGDWFVLNQVTTVGRSVSYTLLPSELVSKVVVKKSSEASLVEGGVAGTVDIITRKPLDATQPLSFEVSAGAVYSDLPSKTDPQFSALANWKNAESTFGVLVQGFYEKRDLRRDGVELLGYDTIKQQPVGSPQVPADLVGVQYPTDIGAAYFTQQRKRYGGLIDVQLRPNDAVSLDLSGFYSKLEAPNYNRNYLLWNTHYINFGAGQLPDPGYKVVNNTLTQATFSGVPGTLYGVYDQISRPDEEATTYFVNLDANFRLSDRLSLFAQGGTSTGHGKTPTQDVSETDPGTGQGTQWSLNGTHSAPNFGFLGNYDNTTPFPGGVPVSFNWIFGAQNVDVVDEETWIKLDATFQTPDSGTWKDLTFGVRQTWHSHSSDNAIAQGPAGTNFSDPTGNYPTTWSNYPSDFNSFGGNIPGGIWYWTPEQLAAYNGPGLVNRDPVTREYYQYLFALSERDSAAYVQADFKGERWAANVGLRYVYTDDVSTTYTQATDPLHPPPNAILTSAFGPFVGIPVHHTYNDFLPSANLKYDLTPNLVGRVAIAETMTRADYSALAGFTNLTPPGAIPGTGSGSGSNPNLKPIRSTNYDAGLEWYFQPKALLAATLFYMDLRNYIGYGSETLTYRTFGAAPDYPPEGIDVPYLLTVPINAKGRATGVELAYQQTFFDHWGIDANYTYTDGKQTSGVDPTSHDDRLVGTSKSVYNVGGFFENQHFSARVSYNYRSSFYSGLDRSTAFSQASLGTLAASLAYIFNDNWSLNLDGQNLNNPTLKYYALDTTQPRAFYRNGRQYYLTIRAKF